MKKIFLIPLMTLLCTVMAFATVHTAGTYDELKAAIDNAQNGDEIQLTADIDYPSPVVSALDVTKSVTIDGKGHTLSGYGKMTNNTYPSIMINRSSEANETELTLKNITITNPCKIKAYACRVIFASGNVKAITLDNVNISAPNGTESNARGIQLNGADSNKKTQITITNSSFDLGYSSYCINSWAPYILNASNSVFNAWCFATLSRPDGSNVGSRGTIINADACEFNTINVHSGNWNTYSCFDIQEDDITINLNNCKLNASRIGDQTQYVFMLNGWGKSERRESPVNINITGDNSNINGILIYNGWSYGIDYNKTPNESADYLPKETFALNINIQGGTYPFNPGEEAWFKNAMIEGEDLYDESNIETVTIPDGYEVKEIATQQGDVATTLYRVRKTITTSYSINDNVQGEGNGLNDHTEFLISSTETVAADSTVANYIEVSGDATLTVPSGKVLEITNGLDVTENATLVVEAGSTIKVGEGGATAKAPQNIVIEANETGAASFLLDPEVIVNTTPNLTVKMTAKQIGRDAAGDYYWHRFALPLAAGATWTKEGSLVGTTYPTYVYAWDYTANDWKNIAPTEMEPLQGYTLTLASEHIDGDAADGKLDVLQDVVYTFTGNLIGNTDRALTFNEEGFNFFGNSYTGYMDAKTMLNGLESGNIDGTVYMWCNDPDDEAYQSYVGVSLYKLNKGRGLENWQKEVAPMQTFILRLRGADSADESVNYAASIWGNPRYGHSTAAPAPRRRVAAISEDTYMEIAVKAANGKGDRVDFTEAANNSDAFESGYDVEKYMNKNGVSLYVTIDGMNYSSVVTDNIEGKALSLKTNNEIAYTISFKNVEGTEYALRDNVTGKVIAIEEGTTYEFAAQPNSTVEGRFEIIGRNNAPTAIENTEVKANVKGIYTIMGQYLGEDFEALPAGVYVVDGVKIVK